MPQRRARRVRKKTFNAVVAGAFLRKRREELELSQRALADRAKVSQQTVVNIERGQGSVTLRNLEAVTLALDLDRQHSGQGKAAFP